jgi:hypothetical protein
MTVSPITHIAAAQSSIPAAARMVVRERDGKTLPGVFASEVAALNFIRTRIARGTEVYADEAGAWTKLHGRFTMDRINHQKAYSLDGDIHEQCRVVLLADAAS